MFFPDITCVIENTLKKNMEYGVYHLVEADYIKVVTVYKKPKRIEIDGEICLQKIDTSVMDNFLKEHINEFLKGTLYSNYYYEGYYFHMTGKKEAKPFIAFSLLCRKEGPFPKKDLKWIDIYTDLNNRRIVLDNTISQEEYYLKSVVGSSSAAIVVLNSSGKVIDQNPTADLLLELDENNYLIFSSIEKERLFKETIREVMQTGTRKLLNQAGYKQKETNKVLTTDISPLPDSKGRIAGVVMVATDITENQMLSLKVEQLKQYGFLGEISLGLAHDIKNPLASIQGCAQLLSHLDENNINRTELCNIILNSVSRINEVVTQMLAYGNITGRLQEGMVNINSVLRNCSQIMERQKLKKLIVTEFEMAKDIPEILGKELHFQQIFLNVILNAMQAIEKKGKIFISTRYDDALKQIQVIIKDTGTGMSEETKLQAFSPYFTTKNDGTGMGLFIVKHTLESYHGTISLDSELGKGTCCKIAFHLR